jgi:hypothetical protein
MQSDAGTQPVHCCDDMLKSRQLGQFQHMDWFVEKLVVLVEELSVSSQEQTCLVI